MRDNLEAALKNVVLGARYHRISPDGPRVKKCSKSEPLVTIYFVGPTLSTLEEEVREIMFPAGGKQYMACNGWVMNADPLTNFALPGCDIYLRRELVSWGDSVKLRFGERPEDSPWIWNFMRQYVEQTARDGFISQVRNFKGYFEPDLLKLPKFEPNSKTWKLD